MLRKIKASSMTRDASANGVRASEKKIKKPVNINVKKMCRYFGYTAAVAFIAIAAKQATGAITNVRAANIVYDNQMARLLAEKKKAEQAVADRLDVAINDDGTITPNDSDSKDIFSDNPSDGSKYYTDENGNIIHIDGDGNETTFYICNTCSKCGEITKGDTICKYCGSDLCRYQVYQVQAGDTLSEVSGKVGASVDSIAHLNEIDNVNLIYTGESLRIPE